MSGSERVFTFRFALVVTSGLCYFMALGVLLPVVPVFVKHELGGNDVAVGVVVGAFSVGAVLLRPLTGRFGDRVGRRVLIIVGGAIVGTAGLLYLLASSIVPLFFVRVLGGVGEAAFFVGAASMITDLAPESRRGEAISYWSIAVYGGLAFGPLIGNLLLGDDHFDRVWLTSAGLAFAAAAIGAFTRDIVKFDDAAREAPRAPLISRAAITPGTVLFLGGIGLAGFTEFVPLYVKEIGMGTSSGVFLLYGGLILAVRVLGARVPDRIGPVKAGTIATATAACGLLVMASIAEPAALYAGTVVFSIGMSFLYPAMLTLALSGLADNERGSAVGTVSSFFDMSQGVGALLLGIVAALSGYRGAFVGGALLSLGAFVLLRTGARARAREPVDHAAAAYARTVVEPEVP